MFIERDKACKRTSRFRKGAQPSFYFLFFFKPKEKKKKEKLVQLHDLFYFWHS